MLAHSADGLLIHGWPGSSLHLSTWLEKSGDRTGVVAIKELAYLTDPIAWRLKCDVDTSECYMGGGTKDLTSLSKKDTHGQVGTYSWREKHRVLGKTGLLPCLGQWDEFFIPAGGERASDILLHIAVCDSRPKEGPAWYDTDGPCRRAWGGRPYSGRNAVCDADRLHQKDKLMHKLRVIQN